MSTSSGAGRSKLLFAPSKKIWKLQIQWLLHLLKYIYLSRSYRALQISAKAHKLSTIYRRIALRVYSVFRTFPDDAPFVISGIIPFDILVAVITNIYNAKLISSI